MPSDKDRQGQPLEQNEDGMVACGDCLGWCRCASTEQKGNDFLISCAKCLWSGASADLVIGEDGEARCPACASLTGIADP